MKPIAGCVVAFWVIGVSAAPAAAQPPTDLWRQLQRLSPGTEIDVTISERGTGRRYFLTASDTELTTLNLTDPALPESAKNMLRSLVETNLEFLLATPPPGTYSEDNVRLGPAGIFIGEKRVGDLGEVVERVTRDRVVDVRRPGGSPLVVNRPTEIGVSATGVLTVAAIGGDLKLTGSFPVSERHSVELFAGPFAGDSSNFDAYEDIKAFYGVQIRQTISRGARRGVEPFISYGALGIISRFSEHRCVQGRCFVTGTSTHIVPPLVGLIGAGVQYAVSPRLAVRVEAGGLVAFVIPIGGRISVGLSVPIGGRPYAK